MLSIEPIKLTETGWTTDSTGYLLDLGWYPESDPDGFYRFVLLRENWDNMLLQFESRDRQKIRSIIERCFDLITSGVKDQDIRRWIELEYPLADKM